MYIHAYQQMTCPSPHHWCCAGLRAMRPACARHALRARAVRACVVASSKDNMQGGGAKKKSPSDFFKVSIGRPVVVKLNSGVEYRGMYIPPHLTSPPHLPTFASPHSYHLTTSIITTSLSPHYIHTNKHLLLLMCCCRYSRSC